MRIKEFTGKNDAGGHRQRFGRAGRHHCDVHVDVLQEGAKGLFGLFGSKPPVCA